MDETVDGRMGQPDVSGQLAFRPVHEGDKRLEYPGFRVFVGQGAQVRGKVTDIHIHALAF